MCTNNFCTYFDSGYLHKGIALYRSLESNSSDFHLYVMALDKECQDRLNALSFPHMTVELWSDWETPEIKKVKQGRSKAEYCWTCGPTIIEHFLLNNNIPAITYLDSDLYFIGNPQIAFDEIGDKSICITENRISEDQARKVGRFCVQFMFFRNDDEGLKCLRWWKESCIEWCYQKFEDNKYADQKYLDEFPKRFRSVCISKNPGVGLAPWNVDSFQYTKSSVTAEGKEYPLVFFHMHGLVFERKEKTMVVKSQNFSISGKNKDTFYQPYAELMFKVVNKDLGWDVNSICIHSPKIYRLYFFIKRKLRKSRILQWLYYDVLDLTQHGHGTKTKN